jgi:hypothetical protein
LPRGVERIARAVSRAARGRGFFPCWRITEAGRSLCGSAPRAMRQWPWAVPAPAEECRNLPRSPRPRCAAICHHCCAARPVARTPRLRSPGPRHPPTPQPASAGARFVYQRHRSEETTLYRVVQEELETFLAQVVSQLGAGQALP